MQSAMRSPAHTLLRPTLLLVVLAAVLAPLPARAAKKKPAPQPPALHPAASIPIQPLGFEPPSMFYLARHPSSLSLNFIDPNHLLFTFRVNALIKRNPASDQSSGEEQIIQADVLDISTGKVVRNTRWTMQDHERYLWSLGHGKFLIRNGNTLYQTGISLKLQPFLTPKHPLRLIIVSPSHKYLSIETEVPADPAPLAPMVDLQGRLLAQPQHINLTVYQTSDLKPLYRTEAQRALNLPVMHNGFLELLSATSKKHKGNLWILRQIQFQDLLDHDPLPKRLPNVDVLTFQSDCQPALLPLSPTVVLTGCAGDGADHLMTAVSLSGKKLWQQWWQARYVWHTMAYASSGNRFALGSIMTDQPLAALNASNISDVQRQVVGVFDADTGKLVLVKDADPIVSAGQNFALSANGNRFAILRNQAIEIFNLPPYSPTQPVAKKAAP